MLHNHKLNEVAKIVKKFDRDLFKKKRDMKIIGTGHEINHVDSQKTIQNPDKSYDLQCFDMHGRNPKPKLSKMQ